MNGQPTRLEPYQLRFLNDKSYFRHITKARQIGFSTIIAGEVLHSLLTRSAYEANVVSINQREAASKVTIARNLYHSIPNALTRGEHPIKPDRPWNDSNFELAFNVPPATSIFVSQPASAAIRGGHKDIYFDESAHIRDMRKLYQASLPAISRGDARISMVSTPLGESGLFWEIGTKALDYPEYSRHVVPWWECGQFVREGLYEEALALAVRIGDPRQRVLKYGTDKIIAIMRGFGPDMDSFITEYEATYVDESDSYFPSELIVNATNYDLTVWDHIPKDYDPLGWVSIGVDLAKKHDKTVFTVVEHYDEDGQSIARVIFVKETSAPYDAQFEELRLLAHRVGARRVSIDETGPGTMFVEKARRSDGIPNSEGIIFTNSKKEHWATTFKGDLQRKKVELIPHRTLFAQIHEIERTKTEANFYRFSGRYHDDYFWSLMLALYGKGRRKFSVTSL